MSQYHFSSVHPFVKRATSRLKVGRPKPLWYDTVVLEYPPHSPFSFSLDSRKKMSDGMQSGDSFREAQRQQRRDRKRLRQTMSARDREYSHFAHLFRSPFAEPSTLPQLTYPQDPIRNALFSKYPTEAIKSTFNLSSASAPFSSAVDTIEAVVERQLSIQESKPELSVDEAQKIAFQEHQSRRNIQAVEEKMAREQALLLGHSSGSELHRHIDPAVIEFAKREEASLKMSAGRKSSRRPKRT